MPVSPFLDSMDNADHCRFYLPLDLTNSVILCLHLQIYLFYQAMSSLGAGTLSYLSQSFQGLVHGGIPEMFVEWNLMQDHHSYTLPHD